MVSIQIKTFRRKTSIYYSLLVLLPIILLLSYYPRIYGTDAFDIMWMAHALRDGALFSDNTWLISPFSYFGYYPFSHRAIGVPMILAFLMSLLDFLSFGTFGLTEAVLVFNIILIIVIYKTSRNLGDRLFEEEWSRFVFVAAILLSPFLIENILMTISTRIIITVIMIILLKINLEIINNSISLFRAIIYQLLLFIIGALAHRLWLATTITIIITIFTVFIRKFENLKKLTLFLILPLSIIAFFVGLEIFGFHWLERAGLLHENSLFLMILFFIEYYGFSLTILSLFFPLGVIIILNKLIISLKKKNEKNYGQYDNKRRFIQWFYIFLYILPFAFMLSSPYYALVIFFPIIIIISIQGLIYIKNFLSTYSKKLSWFLLGFILSIPIMYSYLNQLIYVNIILQLLLFISLILFLIVFKLNKFKNLHFLKFSVESFRLKKGVWILILIIGMLFFLVIRVDRARGSDSRYLTIDEIEIVEYFKNKEVDGLIFVPIHLVCSRIRGFGFLPIFFDTEIIGTPLYYGFIIPDEVHKNTYFSILGLSTFNFFTFNESNPIRSFRKNIVQLNVSLEGDLNLLRSEYKVQYIITEIETNLSSSASWILIKSLENSDFKVFSNQYLVVWKIY